MDSKLPPPETATLPKDEIRPLLPWWAAACVLLLCSSLFLIFRGGVNHDEVEHLAVAVRILQGELPFRDFHQNHAPLFWYSLLPWLSLLYGSITPLFFARLVSAALLLIPFFLCARLLPIISKNHLFSLLSYSFFSLALLIELEGFRVRPDAYMTCVASIAFYLTCSTPSIGNRRALAVGALLGFGIAISIKMAPLVIVLPICALLFDRQKPLGRHFLTFSCYGVGGCLGVLPLLAYLWQNQLFPEFYAQVIELNGNLSKDFYEGFNFRYHIYFSTLLLLCPLMYLLRFRLSDPQLRVLVTSILWVILSYSLLLFVCHESFYNFQLMVFPAALCLSFLTAYILSELRSSVSRLFISSVILFHFILIVIPDVFSDRAVGKGMPLPVFRKVVALAGDGNKTCIGFAPMHPLYCKNVTSVMIDWDLRFFKILKKYKQPNPFIGYWNQAAEVAATGTVDIVTRRIFRDIWDAAAEEGAISQAQLDAIDAQEEKYVERTIHWNAWKIWIRKP